MTLTQEIDQTHQDLVGRAIERAWPGATWQASPLDDGMTNRNFKVRVVPPGESARVVVVQEQLPREMALQIGIRRENQMRVWSAMTEIGLAPALLGNFEDLGVTVVEFVEGTRLSDVQHRDLAIRLVAEALRLLHEHTRGDDTPGLVSDPFDAMTWLEARLHDESPEMVGDFRWALELVERIRIARGDYEMCQVHTDATHVNMFLVPDMDRVTLIDWEYVGAGDGYLDLAHFAARAELSAEEERLLVHAYLGEDDARALAVVRVYRFISMLREGLWSALADGIDFLEEFDHAEYAKECLERMAHTAQSEDFVAALALLESDETKQLSDVP